MNLLRLSRRAAVGTRLGRWAGAVLTGWLLLLAVAGLAQDAPTITSQPASYAVVAGRTAFFSVTATGTGPVNYQWRKDTVNLAGATNALLLMGNVQTNQAGSYSVVVTNSFGTVASTSATLTVSSAPSGTVVAWGTNNLGQTNVPAGLSNVISVAAGYYHSLALKSDGTVVAWQYNANGQTNVPAGLGSVIAIAAGNDHNLALKSDGTVVAWGLNGSGQTNVPAGLNGVVAVAAGGASLALKSDGTVAAWGFNGQGQTNVPVGLSNVVGVAAGLFHSVALKSDGTVVAWGDNSAGQTNVPAGLAGVVALAADRSNFTGHTLALKSDGTVVAWGGNGNGQINVPAGLKGVVMVQAGAAHSLALKSDGMVVAWGAGSPGQVGAGNGSFNQGQGLVPVVAQSVSVAVAAGALHSLAITTNAPHPVLVLVDGDYVRNGSVARVSQAAVILLTTFAGAPIYYSLDGSAPLIGGPLTYSGAFTVTTNVTIRALALNTDDFSTATSEPVSITIIPTYALTVSTVGGGTVAKTPSASSYLSNSVVSITATPEAGWTFLYWTGDTNGITGGSTGPAGATNSIMLDRARSVQAVFGTTLTASVTGSGTVQLSSASGPYPYGSVVRLTARPSAGSYFLVWGGAASGNGFTNPIDFTMTQPNRSVSALFTTLGAGQVTLTVDVVGSGSVAVSPSKAVYATGETATLTAVTPLSSMFDGWSGDSTATTNVISLLLDAHKSVTASFSPVPAGTVVAWGANSEGQTNIPAGLSGVTAIAAGQRHTVALKGDGMVVAWGAGRINPGTGLEYGQSITPAGLLGVTAIAAGGLHTVALRGDGTVVAWGNNVYGQTTVPTGLTNVTAIAAGRFHTVALKGDGMVVAWGFNGTGQTTVPAGLTNVTAIAAGINHTVALRGDGTVVAWGSNGSGQTTVPAGLTNVTAIAAGSTHTVALKGDGTVVAWGYNGNGQTTVPAGLTNVTAIAAGENHTAALIGDESATVPPSLLVQPQSQTVVAGGSVTFTVAAAGSAPFSYQWRSNAVSIAGAMNATLTLTNVQTSFAASYSMVITNAYGAITSAPAVLMVLLGQSITFGSLPNRTFGDAPFVLSASASSDLPVMFSVVSGPVSLSGSTLTLLGAGTVTVRATQAGDAAYAAAAPVEQTFTVAKADQAITFPALPDKSLGDPPFSLSATASSGLLVSFSLLSGPASLSGSTLTMTNGGVVTVRAAQAGNTNYNAAPNVDRAFTVFTNPPPAVTLASPAQRQSYRLGMAVPLSASALDPQAEAVTNLTVLASNAVSGVTQIGASGSGTFTGSWTPPSAGLYTLRAEARDSAGVPGVSAETEVRVQSLPPSVNLLSPANGTSFSLPTNLVLQAFAQDTDGFTNLVALVEFLDFGTNVIGSVAGPTNTTVAFTWTNPPPGQHSLTARATDAAGYTEETGARTITVTYPAGTVPVFSFALAEYRISEAAGSVVLTVLKNQSPGGTVAFTTRDGTARAAAGVNPGDYIAQPGSLTFAETDAQKSITIQLVNDLGFEGDQSFTVELSAVGNVIVTNPAVATVVILDDDPAPTTNSVNALPPTNSLPAANALGALQVSVLTTNRPDIGTTNVGQWRLLWDPVWHNHGDRLEQLQPGSYEVVFQPRDGFVSPSNLVAQVSAGPALSVTGLYSATTVLQTGSLRVDLTPGTAKWRLQGEPAWRDAGSTVAGLVAGPYVVEFNDQTDFLRPSPKDTRVFADFNSVVAFAYAAGSTAWPLAEVDTGRLGAETPYAFNGQLFSESGHGSGTVVKRRVVLTAGHLAFNDRALTFATNVYWFPRRFAGVFEPRPQQPRGAYVFAGYDAQRGAERTPGLSTPASQRLDAAALFFYEDAGAGGQSGYLVSDAGTNWLAQVNDKLLTGYPLDAPAPLGGQRRLQFGERVNVALDAVAGAPGVFTTALANLRSTGGNSGGPLSVKFGGVYYPAGIFLGGAGQSVVRVIDADVVDLINRAELTANTGDNNSDGGEVNYPTYGVIQAGSGTGWLEVSLTNGPAGAGWRLVPAGGGVAAGAFVTSASAATNRFVVAQNLVEFAGVAGFLTPGRVYVPVTRDGTQAVSVVYARATNFMNSVPGRPGPGGFAFEVSASSFGRYVVYGRADLGVGVWVPLVTNTLGVDGRHTFTNPPGTPYRFFHTGYLEP